MGKLNGTRVASVQEVFDGPSGSYTPTYVDGFREVMALWFKLPTGTIGRIPAVGWEDEGEEGWTITEHPGGTVTVHPSIQQVEAPGVEPWHGHLVAGVWTD